MEDAIRYPLSTRTSSFANVRWCSGSSIATSESVLSSARAADTILWSPGFYTRKTAIGLRSVITSATQEKMNTIKNRFYVPNNSALILAGDITPARGFQLAEQIFGDWPRGGNPFATPAPNPPALTKSSAVIVEQPVNGAAFYITWQGPSVTADPAATYAADVLGTVLSNPGSKFQKRLVDSGLTFGVNLNYYTQAHVGPISVFAQTARTRLSPRRKRSWKKSQSWEIQATSHLRAQGCPDAARDPALYQREQSSEYAHTVGFWWQ